MRQEKGWESDFSHNIDRHGVSIRLGLGEGDVCQTQIIHFEGVGKVKIGNSVDYHAEYNRLSVELDFNIQEEEASAKLNNMFAALGLGGIASTPREEDIDRIKVLQLFRAFHPREAYTKPEK